MPVFRTARTWTAGERLLGYWLNTDLRDNQLVLRSPPGAKVVTSDTAGSIKEPLLVRAGDWATLAFSGSADIDREKWDDATLPLFSHSNPSTFTLGQAGLWQISAAVEYETNTNLNGLGIRLVFNNGTNSTLTPALWLANGADGFASMANGTLLCYVPTAGETFEVQATYSSGADPELYVTHARLTARFLSGVGTAPAWTTPATWVNGNVLTASGAGGLNEQIRDNTNALYYRPAAVIGLQADQSILTGTWTTVGFNSSANVWLDNGNGAGGSIWSAGTPTRLTPGLAGKWLIWGKVEFPRNATVSPRAMRLRFNGSATNVVQLRRVRGCSGLRTALTGAMEFNLGATDYVELQVCQNSGGSLDIDDAEGTYGDGCLLGAVFLG